MITRRRFIKNSCSVCATLVSAGLLGSLLSGCASLPVYKTTLVGNKIIIPQSEILPNEKLKIIRSEKLDYDILLVLNENKNYHALMMKCTHIDNGLVATQSGLTCNLHGSTFNLEGIVTNGPAARPLKKYKVTEENNTINIYLN